MNVHFLFVRRLERRLRGKEEEEKEELKTMLAKCGYAFETFLMASAEHGEKYITGVGTEEQVRNLLLRHNY